MPSDTSVCKTRLAYLEAILAKESKTFLVGRNANTGRLTTVNHAKARPSTHVVERMPKSGNGDTKKK
jgi:hypothetical protein